MSNNRSGKLENSYLRELFPPVMRVMAGIDKKDDMSIPRKFMEFPWTKEAI